MWFRTGVRLPSPPFNKTRPLVNNGYAQSQGIDSSLENDYSLFALKKSLLDLVRVSKSRMKINKYLYNKEIIKNYLPHLNVDLGRKGKKYIK
ncbi:MAG: hypothetical protein ABF289_15555 [Clostridiales bacterium]